MTAWVVRAGAAGQHEQYNLGHQVASIDWDVPDLSVCRTREDVRSVVMETYPDLTPAQVAGTTGQLWAFSHGIEPGDLVITPLKTRPGYLLFGRCQGAYRYGDAGAGLPSHTVPVEWMAEPIAKVGIHDDLLYSLNAVLTVFSPTRNNAEERLRAIMGTGRDPGNLAARQVASGGPVKGVDELVTDPASVSTADVIRDEIAGYLQEHFKGHKLTELVAAVLTCRGYDCAVSPPGPDGGIDIVATMRVAGLVPQKTSLIVEVKSQDSPVGAPVLRGLHSATMQHSETHGKGLHESLLVAPGGVTASASRQLEGMRPPVAIWDAHTLIDQLFATYGQLPQAIKDALPLKQAWVLDADRAST